MNYTVAELERLKLADSVADKNGEDRISKLELLTAQIPLMSHLVAGKTPKVTEYDVINGYCISFCLFHNEHIAIARTFVTKGTTFPIHEHEGREIMTCYIGGGVIKETGKRFGVGDCVTFDEHVPHTVYFSEDSWIVVQTIPADKGFPGGEGD